MGKAEAAQEEQKSWGQKWGSGGGEKGGVKITPPWPAAALAEPNFCATSTRIRGGGLVARLVARLVASFVASLLASLLERRGGV